MTQLSPSRFKEFGAEYNRNVHWMVPEVGTPLDALLDPTYWAHVSRFLKPLDRIEVASEDGAWWAELIVISSGKLYANVQLLRKYDLKQFTPGAMETIPAGYHVKYRGPLQKWCVLRDEITRDGKVIPQKDVLKAGCDEEAQARNFLTELLKTIPAMAHPDAPPKPLPKQVETTL